MGYELPKTNQEIRMTTAAGTVIQLMGSDEQFDLPVFPIVLAYNRINHYAPHNIYLTLHLQIGGWHKCIDT